MRRTRWCHTSSSPSLSQTSAAMSQPDCESCGVGVQKSYPTQCKEAPRRDARVGACNRATNTRGRGDLISVPKADMHDCHLADEPQGCLASTVELVRDDVRERRAVIPMMTTRSARRLACRGLVHPHL
jgi:hypothetical protein